MTIPIAPVIGVVAMPNLYNAVTNAIAGNWDEARVQAQAVLGIARDGKFNSGLLILNMTPLFLGFVIHWLASKIGINRLLGRAKIPLVRI